MLSAMRAGRDVGPGARYFGGQVSGRGDRHLWRAHEFARMASKVRTGER